MTGYKSKLCNFKQEEIEKIFHHQSEEIVVDWILSKRSKIESLYIDTKKESGYVQVGAFVNTESEYIEIDSKEFIHIWNVLK